MARKLAVLGTGAIGSSIGADLTKAGHDVLLVDQWPAHVEAMKARGLRINMRGDEYQVPVKAIHLCELASVMPEFDIVFLAAKSYDTRWMVELIKPYLKSDGMLVSAQNSLNDEWIAPAIGSERDIGCVVELSGEVIEPGVVKRNTTQATTYFAVGELDGKITPRVREVAEILGAVGGTEVTANIWGAKWTKLVFNAMSMPVYSAAGISLWNLPKYPRYLDFCIKLGREILQVGAASGYHLEPVFGLTAEEAAAVTDDVLRKLLFRIRSDLNGETRSCIPQDLGKGRRTEVDYFNGLIIKKGRAANVPTPLNEAIVSLYKQIEREKLTPSPATFEILLNKHQM